MKDRDDNVLTPEEWAEFKESPVIDKPKTNRSPHNARSTRKRRSRRRGTGTQSRLRFKPKTAQKQR